MLQHPPITHNLKRLRSASNKLNERASRVQSILESLEDALNALNLDFRFVHPHPVEERGFVGPGGSKGLLTRIPTATISTRTRHEIDAFSNNLELAALVSVIVLPLAQLQEHLAHI